MATPEKKVEMLKGLMEVLDKNYLTEEDFLFAIKALKEASDKVDQNIKDEIVTVTESLESLRSEMKDDIDMNSDDIEQRISVLRDSIQKVAKMNKKGDKGDIGKRGKRGFKGDDGEPADETLIQERIEQNLPQLGTTFRDGLELLQDEERLDAKAIKNLPEFTQEIGTNAGWGAHPLRIEQAGVMKTKIARTLNFTGTGVPTITQTASGVTELDFTAGGNAQTANPLSQFALTTSAELAGVISDETGTGLLVFGTSPTFSGTPTLPTGTIATTQTAGNNTTRIATTAFATTALNLKANLASPTFSGAVALPNGSVASPALVFSTDTNSGLYTVGDGTIAYSSNGTQKFRFDSSGFVITAAGGASNDGMQIFDSTQAAVGFSYGTNSASEQGFGFGRIGVSATVGAFFRSTATGAVDFRTQNYSEADFGITLTNSSNEFFITQGGVERLRLLSGGSVEFANNVRLAQTVTTEAVVSDRTVTIVINGTTYKLLAKA